MPTMPNIFPFKVFDERVIQRKSSRRSSQAMAFEFHSASHLLALPLRCAFCFTFVALAIPVKRLNRPDEIHEARFGVRQRILQ
jgi:hypothetical protein